LLLFENLRAFNPLLAGTIPLGIDLPDSDLDIICHCSNHKEFIKTVEAFYLEEDNFSIRKMWWNDLESTVITFQSGDFEIELFGQDCPTEKQHAFRHMLIEHDIIQSKNGTFKDEIVQLKRQGVKTEPAFAKLLGLEGDPYEALLKLEKEK